jgi:hypothetical protein
MCNKTHLPPVTAVALCLALAACPSTPRPNPAPPAAPAPGNTTRSEARPEPNSVKNVDGVKTYGQPLSPGETIPVSTLVQQPAAYAGKSVTVEGTVRSACTNRGCWLELAESAKGPGGQAAPGCRVTFKDYGFFVPTNSAGSQAKVQGTFELAVVPAARVRHLEQEGATFKNKEADGSARELRLVATGVELWRQR